MIHPGSLDFLYYNGIFDHIPYEIYEMTPVSKSASSDASYLQQTYEQMQALGQTDSRNISQITGENSTYNQSGYGSQINHAQFSQVSENKYLDMAQQGAAYQNSTNTLDTYVASTNRSMNNNNKQNSSFSDRLMNDFGESVSNIKSKFSDNDDSKKFDSFNSNVGQVYNKLNSVSAFIKGLFSGGIILGTLYLILRKKH